MTLAEIALQTALANAEKALQAEVVLSRALDEGRHGVQMGERLRAYAVDPQRFGINLCKAITNAGADRLQLVDWDAVPAKVEGTNTEQVRSEAEKAAGAAADWAWRLWERYQLALTAHTIHRNALRDGESYLMLSVLPDRSGLAISSHPRWTDAESGGDDYGVKMFYANDDPEQAPLYASKWWTEVDAQRRTQRRRRTLYYPDHVEKYALNASGVWARTMDPGDSDWPLPWFDADGKPLGIPVVHFRNDADEPDSVPAWPLQGPINKLLLDLLVSSDSTAFRILVARGGWAPTTDGKPLASDLSNRLVIQPGSTVVTGRDLDKGVLDVIEGAPASPLLDIIDKLIAYVSMVSGVNLSGFQLTRQLAGAETIREQGKTLTRRVERNQLRFGAAWSRAMDIARRLSRVFLADSVPEGHIMIPVWAPAEPVEPTQRYAEATALKGLELPLELVWAKAGLTSEEIEAAKATEEYKARMAAIDMALGRPNG